MADENVIVTELDNGTIEALNEEEQKGVNLLSISEKDTPKQIVEKIMGFVDDILSANKKKDELEELAITFGATWGKMVEKEYNWAWKNIDFGDGNAQLFLLSPREYYCCNPIFFMNKILQRKNIGLDGNNDNTVLLLFNMIDGIEKQKPSKKYQVIS